MEQVGYTPDYLFLLQTILRSDPQVLLNLYNCKANTILCNCEVAMISFCCVKGAVNFALMMSQMEGGCPVDYNTITDLFLQV